jgi:hypothetical protein
MDKHRRRLGLLASAFALTIGVASCSGGSFVPLNYLSASNGPHVCFLPGFSGTLEDDPTAGFVFDTQYGDRIPVLWQPGWTARKSGSVIEVIDSWGTVFARTGGAFSPNGGVDSHGNWDMCELTPLSPAG